MFNFLKKKGPETLYAPVSGKMIALEAVPDEVFASKMMGEGVAFELSADTVTAPADGEITMIPESLHAFGMKTKSGAEILVHVGLNTINLGGKGFTMLVNQGDNVKKGTPILKVDREDLLKQEIILTTPMIITNSNDFDVNVFNHEQVVNGETEVMTFSKK